MVSYNLKTYCICTYQFTRPTLHFSELICLNSRPLYINIAKWCYSQRRNSIGSHVAERWDRTGDISITMGERPTARHGFSPKSETLPIAHVRRRHSKTAKAGQPPSWMQINLLFHIHTPVDLAVVLRLPGKAFF